MADVTATPEEVVGIQLIRNGVDNNGDFTYSPPDGNSSMYSVYRRVKVREWGVEARWVADFAFDYIEEARSCAQSLATRFGCSVDSTVLPLT